MNKIFRPIKIIIALVCLIIPTLAHSQSISEKEVTAVVESLRKAMVNADKATLESLADKQLSYGHSGGKVEDKTAFVESITSGRSDFVTIDLTDQTITIIGNNAIVRHILSASTNDNGKPGTVKLAVMLIWQRQNKHWVLIARQAVKVPAP